MYYGVFSGTAASTSSPGTIWVVSRPHNWRPANSTENLLHLDLANGQELERAQLNTRCAVKDRTFCAGSAIGLALAVNSCYLSTPLICTRRLKPSAASRFAHDAVRWLDEVYICSTGTGSILQYSYTGMKFARVLGKLKRTSHVNTLAPDGRGGLWALLHNKGKVCAEWMAHDLLSLCQ